MNEQNKTDVLASVAKDLISDYKDNRCEEIIEKLYRLKINSPMIFQNPFIKDMYINTHFKYANKLMKEGRYAEAKESLEELLVYENEFMLENELNAYELYSKLVDVYSMCQEHKLATEFNNKAKSLIKKMMAAKEVQNLYLLMTKSDYRGVVKYAKKVDNDMLDDYNRAKLNMVLGNAHFNLNHYKTAVDYLEAAIVYYEERTYNSLTVLMYEELSKCYSNLDEHEKAVLFMQKAKEGELKRHNLS